MAGAKELAQELDFEEWYERLSPRWRTLVGVRSHMDQKYGQDNWGDDEFTQYMLGRYQFYREQEKRLAEPQVPLPSDDEIERRVQEYLRVYEEPAAPNDMVMLRQMATMEVQMESVQTRLNTAIQDGDQARTRTWSGIMKSMVKDHRDIQSLLGIDRTSRDKSKSRDEMVEYIQDIIRKAGEFVDEHAIPIRCPTCMESQAQTELDMGHILFHFRQDVPWKFEFQCPMCGEVLTISR